MYAVTPNPQWGTGKVNYDPVSSTVTAYLDDGEVINGTLNSTTCSEIKWTKPVATWLKLPPLKNVHVVFMNHLDVGYNGIPKTGFINNVLNTYFIEYFPRAIQLAYEVDNMDSDSGFIYTTHPWLLTLYLNCPKNFTLSGVELYCPTPEEVQTMENALRSGHVTWHAGPMNMQVELMNWEFLQLMIKMATDLNDKYKCCSRVWSLRDVPGMTAAAIPLLLKKGIKAVTVGVNPGSAPPAVPKLFQWRPFNGSKNATIAMWNAGGYPLNPGSTLSSPGGLSIMDSVISAEDGEALVFAFRTDNSGPPTSIAEIQSVFDILKQQYPGAKVFASTLDNFVNSINMSSLPTVYGEIGDTWIQGIASDPRKMALYRAAARAVRCSAYPSSIYCDVTSIVPFLAKLPEHTWGLPSVHSTTNWSNADFQKVKNGSAFINAEQSWLEQRMFFNITQQILELYPKTDIEFMKELEGIYPVLPNLNNFTSIDPNTTFKVGNDLSIGFGSDGSIIHISGTYKGRVFSFADKSHPLGTFSYHTYNESDFELMNSQYDYYGNAGYDKPNSTASANPKSAVYHFPMKGLYRNINDESIFLVELEGDPIAHEYYGGPEKVWIQVNIYFSTKLVDPILDLSFEVIWVNKTATRLAEATMFSFTPPLQEFISSRPWQDRLYKVYDYNPVYPDDSYPESIFSVVENGSFYQHAVEQVILVQEGESMTIKLGLVSPDVPLVCPILDTYEQQFKTPTPFPYMNRWNLDSYSLKGFAFNLHNNIWNTNYPLWYPFTEEDKNFKARFHMMWYEDLP